MAHLRSLIASFPRTEPIQDRSHNPINGGDAESYAMGRLLLACRGEGHWGSREEDNSKIDLIFSTEHPWFSNERMMILSQVKSGSTYGRITDNGFELKGKAKKGAHKTSHSICVIWVDRDNRRAFWAYIHPDSTSESQEYGVYHEISPAILFDLARCMSSFRPGPRGAKGLHVRKRDSALSTRRKSVRDFYKEKSKINTPFLGEIELTRLGWRHMFRSGRRESNKSTSLDLIPYLARLLERYPSSYAITDSRKFVSNGNTHQIREHLLKFDKLTVSSRSHSAESDFVAHVRLIEEIRYPNDWWDQVMLTQLVMRRVVLKSAYYKKCR